MGFRFRTVLALLTLLVIISPTSGIMARAGARDHGDKGGAEIEGMIQSLPAGPGFIGDWMVASKIVHVTASTEIDTDDGAVPAVGATVEVKGTLEADGSIAASKIEVQESPAMEADFTGIVTALPATGVVGDWMVGTKVVHVTAATTINLEHLTLAVGVTVEVHGTARADGSIDATRIELQAGPGGARETEFTGIIQALPAMGLIGDWMVSGKTVNVTAATMIKQEHGVAAVGATVEVDGTLAADGSVTATEIDVEQAEDQAEVEGAIASLPTGGRIGDWVIGKTTVHVTSATQIDQEHAVAAVGALAEAKGTLEADGSLDAASIEIKAAAGKAEDADFKGTVSALPTGGLIGAWTVGGKTVNVTAMTRIDQEHGAVMVGSLVEVEGFQMPDGSIDATRIEVQAAPGDVHKVDLEGSIDQLPATGLIGDWTISGTVVHVTADTRLKLKVAPAVGQQVEVTGTLGTDGAITAMKVKVTH